MNIFQVINQSDFIRRLSHRKIIHLTGTKISMYEEKLIRQYTENLRPINKTIKIKGKNSENEIEFNKLYEDLLREILYFRKHEKYTISCDNKFKILFDAVMNVFTVVSIIASLYYLAYQSFNILIKQIDEFIWALFILDFILDFFTQYIDEKYRLVRNLELIFFHNLKGLMIPNLIALVPLRFFGHYNEECFLRLLRLLRAGRIFNIIDREKLSDFIANIFYKDISLAQKQLKLKVYAIWDILIELIKIFFISMILACVWYFYANWIDLKANESDNFMKHFNLEDKPIKKKFFICWYYIFTTLSTVGYGDFYATNKYEMLIAIFLLLAGSTWFAFAMGGALRIINLLNDITGLHHIILELKKWLKMLEERQPLSTELKDRICKYYQYYWENDRLGDMFNTSQENYFNPTMCDDIFFNSLSDQIKTELLDYLFSDVFIKFHLFFKHFKTIKYDLARFLQPRIYSKGSIIIDQNASVVEIFFLSNGRAMISVTIDNSKFHILSLDINNVLGDYFAIKNIASFVEYSASSNVNGFSLASYSLIELSRNHSLNLKRYIDKITPAYDRLVSLIEDSLCQISRSRILNSKDEVHHPLISAFSNDNLAERKTFLDDYYEEMNIHKQFARASELLELTNTQRKELLGNLKEKLSSFIEKKNGGQAIIK